MTRFLKFMRSILYSKEGNRTVRYMYPAILSFMAMLGAAVVTSSDVSYVRLETSDTTIQAGEQFSVQVFAFAHVPVNAIDITLQFDSKSFEVLGVDRGQSVLTIWTRDPVIENGRVLLQGGTFRKGFLDEHLIATINLKAKETGQSTFEATDVVLLAGDGSGSQISVAKSLDSKVSLFVYDENTSPESIGANVTIDLITDLDGDGKVTLKDISTFMAAWHNKDNMYDFNGDGRMTFRDFSIILSNFFF